MPSGTRENPKDGRDGNKYIRNKYSYSLLGFFE